jgi:glycosyltransferase involved in cell wall biosynthesis
MSKVIYVGNYRDGTGWGNVALNNIIAMDKVGIDVIPRCITFSKNHVILPERVLELESKSSQGADIIIQHTLPPLYQADSRFRTIGFYETETTDISDAMWPKFINQLDEAWVPNEQGKNTSLLSGVTANIEVVPHCLDISQYDPNGHKMHIDELEGTFNFFFVGECVERKNIEALLKAFHSEFHPKENVRLVLKTSLPNVSPDEQVSILSEYTNNIKDKLKIRKKYKGDIIVASRLDRGDYTELLRNAHCFVMPSRGEACCVPALECALLEVPVLYAKDNGMEDYVGLDDNSVEASWQPCYGSIDSLDGLHTSKGQWREISVSDLRDKMRKIFNLHLTDPHSYYDLGVEQKKKASQFSHENIGEIIKEKLS